MIIEDIINELDKFITKYKTLKFDNQNLNQFKIDVKTALNRKGIINTSEDSEVINSVNAYAPPKANTTDESFLQQAIRVLKDNHIPYLNSEEDNIQELKKWIEDVNKFVGSKPVQPLIRYEDGKVNVSIYPKKYFGVKVDCVCDSGTIDETIVNGKEYKGVTSMSIQSVDYYGAKVEGIGKHTLNFEFLEKIGSLDKLQVQYTEGWNNDIRFTSVVDGNDYNIFDERMKELYFALLEQKAKSIDSSKVIDAGILSSDINTYTMTGNVKLLILDKNEGMSYGSERYFFGRGPLSNGLELRTKPKYIAVIGSSSIDGFGEKVASESFEERGYTNEWNQRTEKVKVTKTVIYRWDSTRGKYMFESADTLEDWLKTHPIETL